MKKNILVVDDSTLMRSVLCDIIESDSRFHVEDIAKNGRDALELIMKKHTSYDVILMDINMPYMDGIEVIRRMRQSRINNRVIVISSLTKSEDGKYTIKALESGAMDFIAKPESYIQIRNEKFKDEVIKSVCVACGMNLNIKEKSNISAPSIKRNETRTTTFKGGKGKLVALACSTGGPKALKEVIPYIPADINAPVLVVQHMPAGFTKPLAERLNGLSKVTVKEAKEGDILENGVVYIAPGGQHMILLNKSGRYVIGYSDEPPREGVKPCANIMYESLVGKSFEEIVCVVLTGMGADGMDGIRKLESHNRIHVIAQDERTSIVYGMPKAVAEAGLADEVVPLDGIVKAIIKKTGVLNNGC